MLHFVTENIWISDKLKYRGNMSKKKLMFMFFTRRFEVIQTLKWYCTVIYTRHSDNNSLCCIIYRKNIWISEKLKYRGNMRKKTNVHVFHKKIWSDIDTQMVLYSQYTVYSALLLEKCGSSNKVPNQQFHSWNLKTNRQFPRRINSEKSWYLLSS